MLLHRRRGPDDVEDRGHILLGVRHRIDMQTVVDHFNVGRGDDCVERVSRRTRATLRGGVPHVGCLSPPFCSDALARSSGPHVRHTRSDAPFRVVGVRHLVERRGDGAASQRTRRPRDMRPDAQICGRRGSRDRHVRLRRESRRGRRRVDDAPWDAMLDRPQLVGTQPSRSCIHTGRPRLRVRVPERVQRHLGVLGGRSRTDRLLLSPMLTPGVASHTHGSLPTYPRRRGSPPCTASAFESRV